MDGCTFWRLYIKSGRWPTLYNWQRGIKIDLYLISYEARLISVYCIVYSVYDIQSSHRYTLYIKSGIRLCHDHRGDHESAIETKKKTENSPHGRKLGRASQLPSRVSSDVDRRIRWLGTQRSIPRYSTVCVYIQYGIQHRHTVTNTLNTGYTCPIKLASFHLQRGSRLSSQIERIRKKEILLASKMGYFTPDPNVEYPWFLYPISKFLGSDSTAVTTVMVQPRKLMNENDRCGCMCLYTRYRYRW